MIGNDDIGAIAGEVDGRVASQAFRLPPVIKAILLVGFILVLSLESKMKILGWRNFGPLKVTYLSF